MSAPIDPGAPLPIGISTAQEAVRRASSLQDSQPKTQEAQEAAKQAVEHAVAAFGDIIALDGASPDLAEIRKNAEDLQHQFAQEAENQLSHYKLISGQIQWAEEAVSIVSDIYTFAQESIGNVPDKPRAHTWVEQLQEEKIKPQEPDEWKR